MLQRHRTYTRTDTLFPYTTIVRSRGDPTPASSFAWATGAAASPTGAVADDPVAQPDAMAAMGNARRIAAIFIMIQLPEECCQANAARSEEHTSELQSLMRISYAVFCLKKQKQKHTNEHCTEQVRER